MRRRKRDEVGSEKEESEKEGSDEDVVELGDKREHACLGCLRSALRGKSEGTCHDSVGKGTRCARCSRGKSCVPM